MAEIILHLILYKSAFICLERDYSTYLFYKYYCVIIIVYLRNKSWKPECVGSFNMDWRLLVFYPEPEAKDKIY
jgi:hypothetical protein